MLVECIFCTTLYLCYLQHGNLNNVINKNSQFCISRKNLSAYVAGVSLYSMLCWCKVLSVEMLSSYALMSWCEVILTSPCPNLIYGSLILLHHLSPSGVKVSPVGRRSRRYSPHFGCIRIWLACRSRSCCTLQMCTLAATTVCLCHLGLPL